MGKTVRFQIELAQAKMKELERLRELGGMRTKKELFNTALTILKWAAQRRAQGYSIGSTNQRGESFRELDMPFLEAVAAAPEPEKQKFLLLGE